MSDPVKALADAATQAGGTGKEEEKPHDEGDQKQVDFGLSLSRTGCFGFCPTLFAHGLFHVPEEAMQPPEDGIRSGERGHGLGLVDGIWCRRCLLDYPIADSSTCPQPFNALGIDQVIEIPEEPALGDTRILAQLFLYGRPALLDGGIKVFNATGSWRGFLIGFGLGTLI